MNRGQCKNCGLIEGHKGECKPDVPKVKGVMIYIRRLRRKHDEEQI